MSSEPDSKMLQMQSTMFGMLSGFDVFPLKIQIYWFVYLLSSNSLQLNIFTKNYKNVFKSKKIDFKKVLFYLKKSYY